MTEQDERDLRNTIRYVGEQLVELQKQLVELQKRLFNQQLIRTAHLWNKATEELGWEAANKLETINEPAKEKVGLCDDCQTVAVLITKGDHHGGTKTVCRDRNACHRRTP